MMGVDPIFDIARSISQLESYVICLSQLFLITVVFYSAYIDLIWILIESFEFDRLIKSLSSPIIINST
jgi:hypothetical protein